MASEPTPQRCWCERCRGGPLTHCPGVGEYGKGLTRTTVHLNACCDRWRYGQEAR